MYAGHKAARELGAREVMLKRDRVVQQVAGSATRLLPRRMEVSAKADSKRRQGAFVARYVAHRRAEKVTARS